jgi:putative cell wall-binding protein
MRGEIYYMKKTKKALASLAIMGMVATMAPINALAATGVTTDRLYGADRFQTAVKVADKFVSADTAILAPAADANLVDALAAAPLAGKNAPILLTENNTLNDATKAELIKLGVTKVYVVGAIDQAVVDQVNAMTGVTATVLKGDDRIATAAMISSKLTNPAGSFVVGYDALADALSVASYAAANNYSILVTNPDGSFPDSEAAYKGAKVYMVGGPTLVDDIAGATRLAGADRFATNKVVLDTLGYSYNKVYVANGTDAHLVDSLVASSLAAASSAPIVLTDTATGGDAAAAAIGAKLADNAVVVALGGSTVVSNTTVAKVTNAVPATLAVSSVSAINAKEIVVKFNRDVNTGSAEDESNYTVKIGGTDLEGAFEATVDEDDATKVTLLLDVAIQAVTSVDVTVSEDLLDDNLAALGDDYKVAFVFYDEAAPEIANTEVDGNELTITFNEYVSSIDLIKVDGNVVTANEDLDAAPVKEITIDITDLELEDGSYAVSLANVADLQTDPNIAGYLTANFKISDTDASPAVESIKQTGTNTFEIKFNKALSANPTVVAKKDGADVFYDIESDDNIKYTVTVADVDGVVDVYDDNENTATLSITVSAYQAASNDMYGDKYTTTLKMTKDVVGPVLLSGYNKVVTVGTEQVFQLRFGEVISAVDVSKIIVVDEDGVKLSSAETAASIAADTDGDDTIIQIDLDANVDGSTIAEGTYTITLSAGAVEDSDENDSKAITTTVKKTVSTSKIESITAGGADDIITVGYEVKMTSSALSLANYKIDGVALPSGTSIYFTTTDKNEVIIDLPAGSIKDDSDVILAISKNVIGDDGQVIATNQLYKVVSGLTDNVKPVLKSAEKTNSTTITLTFSEDVDADAFAISDFKVKVNGVEVIPTGVSVVGDEVELSLSAYNTNQSVVVIVVDSPADTTDLVGNILTSKTSVTATK